MDFLSESRNYTNILHIGLFFIFKLFFNFLYLNRIFNAIQAAPVIYALIMRGAIRDEDEKDLDSFLRDILPSGWSNMIMWMIDFKKYAYKGAKLYIPTPFKEATGVINQYMK